MAGVTAASLRTFIEDPDAIEQLESEAPWLWRELMTAGHPINQWTPRADRPDLFDQQTAFVESTAKVAVCLGGTGSGKTDAAAFKVARRVCLERPPRAFCPFWVVGQNYSMVGNICWVEKLSRFIPKHCIERIVWLNEARQWPLAVIMMPIGGHRWVIEFKSFEQGRRAFQGASIGGWWLNEEGPLDIVEEVLGRCRDYNSPGWADFTPLDKHSIDWKEKEEDPPPGWEFYSLNVRCNEHLAQGWADEYLESIPADMRATREHGAFASRSGAVFKEFRRHLHIIEPFELPSHWHRIRGIDFGWNHPTACVWVGRDMDHNYFVYDSYMASGRLLEEHARDINARDWQDRPEYGRTYADTAGGQEIAEFTRYGIQCSGARKSIELGIECVRRLLMPQPMTKKPRLFIMKTDNNKMLIKQIQQYHWDTPLGKGDRMREARDLPVKFNDDLVDALRYAIYTEESGGYGDPQETTKPAPIIQEWKRAAKGFLVGVGGR